MKKMTTPFSKIFYELDVFSRVPPPKENYKAGKDWVALGFQGANPTTDFRATGHLGLKFLKATAYLTQSLLEM